MTAPKSEDLRIQRTHSLLLQALIGLLTEKTFEEIRVTDLCERAGVHRSTFYAHFEDKHHLLTFGIQELVDIFVSISPAPSQDDFQWALRRVFRYFLQNRKTYSLLFLDPRNASAKRIFQTEYIRAYRRRLLQRFPDVPSAELNLFSHYFIGGLLTVIEWMLNQEDPAPPDEMAVLFCRAILTNHPTIFPFSLPGD